MGQRKPIVAGNWKMNGSLELIKEIAAVSAQIEEQQCEVLVFPPAVLLSEAISAGLKCGTQTVSEFDAGAYTSRS